MYETNQQFRERAILIGISLNHRDRWQTEEHLEELAALADTAGAEVIDKIIQERPRIDPAYFIGRGKAQYISNLAAETNADIIIFDDDLSPAQVRNLEKLTGKKILDRSGLILDIFARRAKTKEARTQVELAQLKYLLPRLTRQWTHLSRQVGGIGTRGPGETQLEVDRRVIRQRINALTRALNKIHSQRQVRRQHRDDAFKVALIGYTNVGKSTLMNMLTRSDVFVEDRLFATLDATVRRLHLSKNHTILLIDTVGFIRKLPHHLIASFMSTLEEARVADLLLHVVDVSHPQLFEQMAVVKDVLSQLKIVNKPTIYVFNKVDKLEQKALIQRLKQEFQPSVFISAAKGLFLDDLKEAILQIMESYEIECVITLDVNAAWVVPKLYKYAEEIHTSFNEEKILIHLKIKRDKIKAVKNLLQSQLNGNFHFEIIERIDEKATS